MNRIARRFYSAKDGGLVVPDAEFIENLEHLLKTHGHCVKRKERKVIKRAVDFGFYLADELRPELLAEIYHRIKQNRTAVSACRRAATGNWEAVPDNGYSYMIYDYNDDPGKKEPAYPKLAVLPRENKRRIIRFVFRNWFYFEPHDRAMVLSVCRGTGLMPRSGYYDYNQFVNNIKTVVKLRDARQGIIKQFFSLLRRSIGRQ